MNTAQKLKEMLDQGKLTQEDYDLLRANLPPESEPPFAEATQPFDPSLSEAKPISDVSGAAPAGGSTPRPFAGPAPSASPGSPAAPTVPGGSLWNRMQHAPWQLQLVAVLWVVKCAGEILVRYYDPWILVLSTAKMLLALGLLSRWKPAYVIALAIACVSGASHLLSKHGSPVVALTSVAAALALIAALKYFFPGARAADHDPQAGTW